MNHTVCQNDLLFVQNERSHQNGIRWVFSRSCCGGSEVRRWENCSTGRH